MYPKRLLVRLFFVLGALSTLSFANEIRSPRLVQNPGERIEEIAKQLEVVETSQQAVPLMTELARLCGFSIWREDRTPVAASLNAEPLKLAITETEVKNYSAMFVSGQSVRLGDLAAGLDVFFDPAKTGRSCAPMLATWMNASIFDPRGGVRALGLAFDSLRRNGRRQNDMVPFNSDTELNPVTTLFVMRAVTEDVAHMIRTRGRTNALPVGSVLFASRGSFGTPSIGGMEAQAALPGWMEDGYVGTVTGLAGGVWDGMSGSLGTIGKGVGISNSLLSIAKFISTYAFMKATPTVEPPGNPLVRTMDGSPGSRRTLAMKFEIEATGVQDWLKENRVWIASLGVDVDMPVSGPMGGIETRWELGQSRKYATKQLVHTARESGDMSKIKTDDKGVARLVVDGAPQPYRINPKNARPVMKSVKVWVTPQAKATEIKQDINDAVFGAIGLRGGPLGLLSPIMECLYRMKWAGTQSMILAVKDWEEGDVKAEVSFLVEGYGADHSKYGTTVHSVRRMMNYTDFSMTASGGLEVPKLDPEMLKALPPEMRKQMEEAIKSANQVAVRHTFVGSGPGTQSWFVDDQIRFSGEAGECDPDWVTQFTSVSGQGWKEFKPNTKNSDEPPLRISVDTKALVATFSIPTVLDVIRRVVTSSRKKGGQPKVEQFENAMSLLDDVEFEKEMSEYALELPVSIKQSAVETVYTGQKSIPFTFGPEKKFKGKVIANYTIRWLKKGTK